MLTSKFILVAESVIKDSDLNSISILNIIEDIMVESFPIGIQKFAVVIFFDKDVNDPDTSSVTLVVKNNDNTLMNQSLRLDFKGKHRNRTIIRIGALIIPSSGTLSFSIIEGDREVCSYAIPLQLRENVQVTSTTTQPIS